MEASQDQFIPEAKLIDINNASMSELNKLNILTNVQIFNILNHIKKHGNLVHLAELQSIEGMSNTAITTLIPLITIDNNKLINVSNFKKQIYESKHLIVTRADRVFQKKAGFNDDIFAGDQNRYYLKYQLSNKYLTAGITSEKDPGEKVHFGEHIYGFDYLSGHLFAKDLGLIKQLTLGDYSIETGQGLNIWSGFSLGKSTDVFQLHKNARKIVPYRSTNENRFMRGVATTIEFNSFSLTTFYSRKKIDANLSDQDTTDTEFTYSSYLQNGLHRTENEIINRKKLSESIHGGYFSWDNNRSHIGVSYINTRFDGNYTKAIQPYNQFEQSNNNPIIIGCDFSYSFKNTFLFGEVSRSKNGGIAFLTSSIINLSKELSVVLLARNYQRNYSNIYSNSIGENSKIINERGILIGFEAKINRNTNITGYFDFYQFPWLKFQVNSPSNGHETIIKMDNKLKHHIKTQVRYMLESKQKNEPSVGNAVRHTSDIISHNLRLHMSIPLSTSLTLRSRVEYKIISHDNKSSRGFILYEDLAFRKMQSPFSITARILLFETDNFNTRVYTYENDLPYSFSITSNFYNGCRYYLLVKYRVSKKISAWVKYGSTYFADRTEISSGNNLISGNKKTDIKILLKYSF